MSKFITVVICKTEADAYLTGGGTGYISGRGVGMSRSPRRAWELANRDCERQLGAKSPTGGVPIWMTSTVNGVETIH